MLTLLISISHDCTTDPRFVSSKTVHQNVVPADLLYNPASFIII